MTDERLSNALFDDALPLLARLDAAREILRDLVQLQKDINEKVRDLVADEVKDEDLTAALYWMYDDLVPTSLLGQWHHLREVIDPRCPWTYPCPSCGRDQPVRSRSQLRELRALADGKKRRYGLAGADRCSECSAAAVAEQSRSWRDREAAYTRRLRELKTMPYREYLQSPEWQERRKARLKAARYRCQVCNTRDVRLNVHHRTYIRRGEELAADLIVLCEECHHLFHRNGSLAPHGEGG